MAGLAGVYRIQDPEKRRLDAATRAGLPGQFIQLQEALQTLFTAFRAKEWEAARQAIEAGREVAGEHQDIFDTYEERIAHYELEPPPMNWDGAWVATSK